VKRAERHIETGDSVLAKMEALALDGWCVVLKRLPPGRGWVIEGARSEYDAPSPDKTIGHDLWCCELSDMDLSMGHEWRQSVDGIAATAVEAVDKATEQVRMQADWRRKLKAPRVIDQSGGYKLEGA
jgi:hypothetical protein